MAYLCYLYGPGSRVPHLRVLAAGAREEARREAQTLLRMEPTLERAEIWVEERLLETITGEPQPNRSPPAR